MRSSGFSITVIQNTAQLYLGLTLNTAEQNTAQATRVALQPISVQEM